MSLEAVTRAFRGAEWKLFACAGVVVGVMFNVALHARPYHAGGIAGGLLSGLLIYLLA